MHIGHIAGAYLPADIYTRYKRLRGEDVVHVSGTDEHGVAITIQAEKEGISPKALVDHYYRLIEEGFKRLGIDFDFFSRTSIERHHLNAQSFFLRLMERDYVFKRRVKQFYCPQCKRFLPDRYVVGSCPHCGSERARGDQCEACGRWLEPTDLRDPRCAICGTTPLLKGSYHYYFRLSSLASFLEEWLVSKKNRWKENVLGLALSWVREGLKDRAITRDLTWGVQVPLEEATGKVLYVWFDAPIGYITATQEWADQQGDPDLWKKYWLDHETKLVHFIGKDNIVFHALVWPAMLKGHGEYVLPAEIPANEFLNLMGQKISTSRGWALWVHEALEYFEEDYLRFGLSSILPESKDSDFDLYDFQRRVHSDLADNLGNFIHRTFSFIRTYMEGRIPEPHDPGPEERELLGRIEDAPGRIGSHLENFRFRQALKELLELSSLGNRYFDRKKPWVTRKNDPVETERTLGTSAILVKALATLMEPFLPFTAKKLRKQLGIERADSWEDAARPSHLGGKILGDIRVLFEKIPDEKVEALLQKLKSRTEGESTREESKEAKKMITFDEFKGLDLRIGKVLEVEDVEGAEKLYKLKVSLGERTVVLVAGLKGYYTRDELLNRDIVVIANLEPATIRGIRSEGMLLAAVEDGRPVILVPEREVPPGTPVS